MNESMQVAFVVLGVALAGLLGFLAVVLYKAWENQAQDRADQRSDRDHG